METILYQKDRIVLFAEYGDPALHKHFAKHILLSDRPFLCRVDGQEHVVRSMMIRSQVLHSVKTVSDARMVVFFIDETSALSKQIQQRYLAERSHRPLPPSLEQALLLQLRCHSPLQTIDQCVAAHFRGRQSAGSDMDPRIARLLHIIEESETLPQDIYDSLSSQVCLSKSRCLHLFKETIGIDLKNYLLLKRMEKTYRYVT